MNDHKKVFSFKHHLNWRIKDNNPEIQQWNLSLYKVSLFAAFIFIITMSPLFIFIYITLNNPNLNFYYEHYDIINQYINVPSKIQITGLLWTSFGISIATLVILVFFKPLVTMNHLSHKRQFLIIILIVFSFIFALLLGALSQYNYAQFESFFKYEAATKNNKVEAMVEISNFFTESSKNDTYHWQSITTVWWTLFIQLMFIFGILVALQNKVFYEHSVDDIEKYITYNSRTKNITSKRLFKKISLAFSMTDKTLSLWMVLIAVITIFPQLIFTIILTSPNTNIHSVLDWTYNMNALLQDYQGVDVINDAYKQLMQGTTFGSFFLVNSLPIIMAGITFSTTFFFISVTIRGEKNSNFIFSLQYFVLFIELIGFTAFGIYTKIETNELARLWSTNEQTSTSSKYLIAVENMVGPEDWKNIIALHPMNGIQYAFKAEWFHQTGIIVEAVIEFLFIISSFAIVQHGSNKIKKTKKELANVDNASGGLRNVKTYRD